jgi:hypothetical protein
VAPGRRLDADRRVEPERRRRGLRHQRLGRRVIPRRALIEHWNGRTWNQVRGPASSILQGVAAVSTASAWAVGYNNAHGNKTLILRLTGTTWTRVPSPSPAGGCIGAVLCRVAATPASAWAVGGYACAPRTLTLRWNGTTWKQVPSPTRPAATSSRQ